MASAAAAGAQAASGSAGPADSYIGSLISLTSKSEIRYEGVLYNINTEESSIGLRNVRSFGTEGRKKDGQQVLPSDKVYEYILFRGSDIKDLQVKSSPPVPTPAPIHNDPAIIQSHYSRPPALSTSLPAADSGLVADPSSQMGLPRSTFQGGLPLYQPGGGLGSWGPSPPPPSANGGALPVPMYWQGFYPPHMQQQSLLRPPPGLSVPHPNILQYTGMSASLPTGTSNAPASMFPSSLSEFPPPLFPPVSSAAMNLPSSSMASTLSSTLAPAQTVAVASETSSSLMPNMAPSATLPTVTPSSSLSLVSPMATSILDINVVTSSASNKLMAIPGASLPYQTMSRSMSSSAGTSRSSHPEASTPSLVTPDQLLQPGSTTLPSLQSSKPLHKDVEVVPSYSEEPLPSAKTDVQVPILPLPTAPSQNLNGPPSLTRHNQNFRGRQRGRGSMIRNATQFTEDFDFIAMNEKFNKDEVWGDLGKNHKQGSGDEDDEDYLDDEDYSGAPKLEKPVYVKDDFFDSLSSNALDHASGNGRTKFSEQRKIDTETFGEFSRYRGGRGGRGPFRGGRSRGPHYGRGYGYGYAGRGRGWGQGQGQGQTMSNRFN